MTKRYSSFLIRCWRLDDGEQRIKIEHIQTGQVMQVMTLAAAVGWLDTRWSERDRLWPTAEDSGAADSLTSNTTATPLNDQGKESAM